MRLHNGKMETLSHYGGSCADCGESDHVVLEFHHINGLTKSERVKRRSGQTGVNLSLQLKRDGYPEDIAVLCSNCHTRRHYLPPDR